MKKIICVFLTLITIFSLASCSKGIDSDKVEIKGIEETLWLGETLQLTGQWLGDDERYFYEWSSSNEAVAEISSTTNGVEVLYSEATVTSKERGKTTITLKIYANGKNSRPLQKKFELKVITEEDLPEAEDFGFDFSSLTLKTGEKFKLEPTLYPEGSVFKKAVKYKSENTDVATVDVNGQVTGIAAGETTISMTVGDKSLYLDIKVLSVSDSIDVVISGKKNPESINVEINKYYYFTVKFNPSDTDTKTYIAFSGNDHYLVADSKKFIGKTEGETTLTIECSEYPELKRVIKVNIYDPNSTGPKPFDAENEDDPWGTSSENESETSSENESKVE